MKYSLCLSGLSTFYFELVFEIHYDEILQIAMVEKIQEEILLLTLFIFS